MKYCPNCGNPVSDFDDYCSECGYAPGKPAKKNDSTMATVVKVFLIIGCISALFYSYGIGLLWCVPITLHVFKCLNSGKPVGTAMKIITLLFVSLVSGICLLCMNDD